MKLTCACWITSSSRNANDVSICPTQGLKMGLIKLMDHVSLLWLTLRKHWTQIKCFKGFNEGFRNPGFFFSQTRVSQGTQTTGQQVGLA